MTFATVGPRRIPGDEALADQLRFGAAIRIGVIVVGVLGEVRGGGRVRELVVNEEPAEFDADVLGGVDVGGETLNHIVAVLNARVADAAGNRNLVRPSSPRCAEAGGVNLRTIGDEVGAIRIRMPGGEDGCAIRAVPVGVVAEGPDADAI